MIARVRWTRGTVVFLVAGILLVAGAVQARSLTLRWKYPGRDPVQGFRVYVDTKLPPYRWVFEVGKPTPDASGVFSTTVKVPDGVTLWVAVTAYDKKGHESHFSNYRKYPPPSP